MNLVVSGTRPRSGVFLCIADLVLQIDDAVEVKQVSKTNDTETRRPLGVCFFTLGSAVIRGADPDNG